MSTDQESAATRVRRWNFDADEKGILVCKGQHEWLEHCEAHMERLHPAEVLKIINELRSECLEWEARARLFTSNL